MDDGMVLDEDQPASWATGTPTDQPPHSEYLTPQWWRPRWKVAREQILEDRIPWKPSKGTTQDITGQQQIAYDQIAYDQIAYDQRD